MTEFDEKEFKVMCKYVNKFFNNALDKALKETELEITDLFTGHNILMIDVKSGDKEYKLKYDKQSMFLSCDCENGSLYGINNRQLCKHKVYVLNNLDRYMRNLK